MRISVLSPLVSGECTALFPECHASTSFELRDKDTWETHGFPIPACAGRPSFTSEDTLARPHSVQVPPPNSRSSFCCGTWIRTKIHSSRGSSPTVRRSRNARQNSRKKSYTQCSPAFLHSVIEYRKRFDRMATIKEICPVVKCALGFNEV